MPAIINKFFTIPFANSGDTAVIPNAIQPSGSISYTQGFTVNYTFDPNTNPAALEVPRLETNQIFLDTTTALKQYQVFGTPNFISTSDNLGTPYPYDTYCRALYDDGSNGLRPYISLSDSNSTLPTDTSNWIVDDLDIQTWRQSKYNTYISTGTPNALVVNPTDPYLTADLGTQINVVANATNTGPATLNISGLGNYSIVIQGPLGVLPLLGGEMLLGRLYNFIGIAGSMMILQNPSFVRNYFALAGNNTGNFPFAANQVPTTLRLNNSIPDRDRNGWINGSLNRVQPTIPGYYKIYGKAALNFSGPKDIALTIYKNGVFETGLAVQDGGVDMQLGGSATIYLNGISDYITLVLTTSSTSGGTVTGVSLDIDFLTK
jgi:hypothetical protein